MQADQQTAILFGIAKRCPHGEALSACPLTDIRKQPLERRHKSLSALSPDLVSSILGYHKNCSDQRDYVGR